MCRWLAAGFIACGCASNQDDSRRSDSIVVDDSANSPRDSGEEVDDTAAVDSDGDGWSQAIDCDDDDARVHPEAEEVCANGLDDDCDDVVDGCDVPLEGNVRQRFYDPDAGKHNGFGKSLTFEPRSDGDVLWMSPQNLVEAPKFRGATSKAWPLATVTGFSGEPGWTRHLIAAAGDYDGDAQDDLALGARGDAFDEAFVFAGPILGANTVDDAFASFRATGTGGPFLTAVHMLGDVTGDDTDDLLFAGQTRAWIIAGPLSGSLDLDPVEDAGLEGLTAATSADLDGDGSNDLVALNSVGSPNARVFRGPVVAPLDAFAADAEWREELYPGFGTIVATGDFDGDGLVDVVASDWGASDEESPGVVYLMSDVSAVSGSIHDLAAATVTGAIGDRISEFALDGADFDHDGVSDLVTAAVQNLPDVDGGGYVAVVLGPLIGAATIESSASLVLRGQSGDSVGENVATGDIDADGEIDLAITSRFPSTDWDVYTVDVVTPVFVLAD